MKVLLIISQDRFCQAALNAAMQAARNQDLHCAYIIDSEFASRFEAQLTDSFVAEKPGQNMADALNQEYRNRAQRKLQSLSEQAQVQGLKVTSEVRSGEYFETIAQICVEQKPGLVVISEGKRGFLEKLFGKSDQKRLAESIDVPIQSF